MYKTCVFDLAQVTFAAIDVALADHAKKGFGVVTGPVYLPVNGSPGALIYTLADLRDVVEPSGGDLPKPQIIPRQDGLEDIEAEANKLFEGARRAQGE